ncbi:placenta-specific gene 8 protein [Labeo rohita]|uniref:Placenta-specific gene 8 protein n=1 Tax=Labeo rohita TaxID=84645 RepID=A0A498MJ29_LABRO|nr:placenta-specific gene 8 protein [Labeo rohita]
MSCCDDMGVCCCGFFCLPCLGCSIAKDMNECCCCGLGMPIRSVYRTKYNIPIMALTSQPVAFGPKNFHTELTSCCDDMGIWIHV